MHHIGGPMIRFLFPILLSGCVASPLIQDVQDKGMQRTLQGPACQPPKPYNPRLEPDAQQKEWPDWPRRVPENIAQMRGAQAVKHPSNPLVIFRGSTCGMPTLTDIPLPPGQCMTYKAQATWYI